MAKEKGISATIINGPSTDSLEIEEMGYPVYSKNSSPMTTRIHGFDGDINIPVSVDGVVVSPGDLIVGDNDGILIIPNGKASHYLEVGEMELAKDERRKVDIEKIGVDKYLKNINYFLNNTKINWF